MAKRKATRPWVDPIEGKEKVVDLEKAEDAEQAGTKNEITRLVVT